MKVDAVVFPEAPVFGHHECVLNDLRDVLDVHDRSFLESELGDEATVRGIQLRGLSRLVLVEDLYRGAASGPTDHCPRRVAEADAHGKEEAEREERPANQRRVALPNSSKDHEGEPM